MQARPAERLPPGGPAAKPELRGFCVRPCKLVRMARGKAVGLGRQSTSPRGRPIQWWRSSRDARSSVKHTIKLMKLSIANKPAIDQDAVEDLHDGLIVALQALSSAFKLD